MLPLACSAPPPPRFHPASSASASRHRRVRRVAGAPSPRHVINVLPRHRVVPLEAFADVHAKDDFGCTALHEAGGSGRAVWERHAQRRCRPSCCKKQNSRNQVLTGFEPPTPGRDPKVTPEESGCLLPTRLPMRLPRGLVTAGAFDICTRAILSESFAISHFLFLRF